jgi:hypothetical protein
MDDDAQQPLDVVARSTTDRMQGVAQRPFEPAPIQAVIGLQVPDVQQSFRLARPIALGLQKSFGLRLDILEAALERLTT